DDRVLLASAHPRHLRSFPTRRSSDLMCKGYYSKDGVRRLSSATTMRLHRLWPTHWVIPGNLPWQSFHGEYFPSSRSFKTNRSRYLSLRLSTRTTLITCYGRAI